jgi:hypothetical protein
LSRGHCCEGRAWPWASCSSQCLRKEKHHAHSSMTQEIGSGRRLGKTEPAPLSGGNSYTPVRCGARLGSGCPADEGRGVRTREEGRRRKARNQKKLLTIWNSTGTIIVGGGLLGAFEKAGERVMIASLSVREPTLGAAILGLDLSRYTRGVPPEAVPRRGRESSWPIGEAPRNGPAKLNSWRRASTWPLRGSIALCGKATGGAR